jgi:hypothetical protein
MQIQRLALGKPYIFSATAMPAYGAPRRETWPPGLIGSRAEFEIDSSKVRRYL